MSKTKFACLMDYGINLPMFIKKTGFSTFFAMIVIAFILTACAQPTPQTVVETVKETVIVTQPPPPTYTPYPTYTPPAPLPTHTPHPTYTPAPTYTPQPPLPTHTPYPTYTSPPASTPTSAPTTTPTPAPTATPTSATSGGEAPLSISKNHVATQTQGSLTIKISRILIADKAYIERETGNEFTALGGDWETATVVGEFMMIIKNESGKTLAVYPDQGVVLVGSRQIELTFNTAGIAGLDDAGGDIFAGITKVSGFWFPLPRVDMADVKTVTLRIDAPHDENFDAVGEDFVFIIDLSDLPDEPYNDSVVTP